MNSLELAIKMEMDGKKFYLEQAEKNKGNELEKVFKDLADDEQDHADILKSWNEERPYELEESTTFEDFKNVFEDSDHFKSEIKPEIDLLDAYRMALDKEKESIELYKKMLDQAEDEDEKALFQFLIKQENIHYNTLQNIIEYMSRPEEWVEAPEFGVRKEY